MQNKKIPMRRCTGCMISKPKKELLRIVHTPEGEIKVDVTGKLNGRGAYICRDAGCLETAVKAKRLNREFEMTIPDSVYDELRKTLVELATAAGGGNIE